MALRAAVNTVDTAREIGTGWGASDLFVQPVWLQWSPVGPIDTVLAYGFYAPTGRFEPGSRGSTGLGFWTQQVQAAGAWYADEERSLGLVLASTWEMNGEVRDEDIDPGNRFTLNWAISKVWMRGALETAVVGYDQWQTGPNTGRGVLPLRRGVLDEIHAAGLQLGVPKLGLSLKYLHEYGALARFQGQVLSFTFTVPIDVLVGAIRSS